MKLTIHRGTHEVGGSCVELKAGGSRLLLDLGSPLVNRDGSPFQLARGDHSPQELVAQGVLPKVPGLYSGGTDEIVGLILSHAHPDHYGLADCLHPSIPIYASEGTRALLNVSRIFLPYSIGDRDVQILRKGKPVRIGPFTITAYLVDHSAPDALALLVGAEGKRIFYSGDLRAHGRKGILFERLLRQPPADIDCLLLEGTTLGRGKQAYPDERTVENAIVEVLKTKTDLGLIFCSSQNIDRLISVYRAVRRAGSTLVIDLYTAYVLRTLQCLSSKLPQFDLPDVRVKYWRHHAECLASAGQRGFLYFPRGSKLKR